jgi:hypothetical protein
MGEIKMFPTDYLVLIRKPPFSDERDQSRHGGTLSHQQNICNYKLLS